LLLGWHRSKFCLVRGTNGESDKEIEMATNFEGVTTAELIANIKKQLAERKAQFERDYPVNVGA